MSLLRSALRGGLLLHSPRRLAAVAVLTFCGLFLVAMASFSAKSAPPQNSVSAAKRGGNVVVDSGQPSLDYSGDFLDPRLFSALDSSSDGLISEGEIAWEMQKRIGRHIKK